MARQRRLDTTPGIRAIARGMVMRGESHDMIAAQIGSLSHRFSEEQVRDIVTDTVRDAQGVLRVMQEHRGRFVNMARLLECEGDVSHVRVTLTTQVGDVHSGTGLRNFTGTATVPVQGQMFDLLMSAIGQVLEQASEHYEVAELDWYRPGGEMETTFYRFECI